MKTVKRAIPVYDIRTINGTNAAQEELTIRPFADYLAAHPNLYRPHGHSFYHLVLFTAGGGFHTIDFRRFKVRPGQAYFMAPGQVHSWAFEGNTDGFVVNFPATYFKDLLRAEHYLEQFPFLNGLTGDNVLQLSKQALDEAVDLMQLLLREANGQQPYREDRMRLLLLSFFITCARAAENGQRPQAPNAAQLRLYNFRKMVNEHYTTLKLPKEYAALLYITPNHLNALSKDLLGKPAGEVIRDRVILEAKRQLVNADLSISDIAYQLGFSDNSYFTKFFKKHTGSTPEDFKKTVLQPA